MGQVQIKFRPKPRYVVKLLVSSTMENKIAMKHLAIIMSQRV